MEGHGLAGKVLPHGLAEEGSTGVLLSLVHLEAGQGSLGQCQQGQGKGDGMGHQMRLKGSTGMEGVCSCCLSEKDMLNPEVGSQKPNGKAAGQAHVPVQSISSRWQICLHCSLLCSPEHAGSR